MVTNQQTAVATLPYEGTHVFHSPRTGPASSRRHDDPDATGPLGGRAKRAVDIALAAAALALAFPILLILGALIRLSDGGSAIFAHPRVGFGGREFKCMKLRSMHVDSAAILKEHLAQNEDAAREWARDQKLRDDPRVTRVGRLLRASSLDELPQLINVLRGDMSIVGPRPVTQAELQRYGSNVPYYLRTRPGITGLWQVSGRSDLSYEARVQLNCRYVQGWSLNQDVAIVARTVPALLLARGSR